MKLGEMLVRDSRLSEDQLAQAMETQSRDGGRLGSILVELGFLDAETVTVYLGLELGIPIATGPTLERCKRSAVRLLKPEQAAKYRCIPIVIQGQTLIVAMDTPLDLVSLDAISAITGYRIIPRVAPETRIHYYLERFYGVSRPPRFARLGDSPRGSRRMAPEHRDLPAPPLPGLPPRHDAPVPNKNPLLRVKQAPEGPVAPPPVPTSSTPAPPEVVDEASVADQQALAHDAEEFVDALDADDADDAEVAEEITEPEVSDVRAETASPAVDETYSPLALEEAMEAMEGAESRGEIASAVLGYACGQFEVATLFLVRDNMAFGWKGFGPEVDRERIDTLLIPLDAPSIFQIALHSDHLFRGRPFPATLHNHLYRVLRCEQPGYALVTVIAIGHRIVNMLYAHKPSVDETTEADVEALRKLTAAAAQAYVRLITVTKKRRSRPSQAPNSKDDSSEPQPQP